MRSRLPFLAVMIVLSLALGRPVPLQVPPRRPSTPLRMRAERVARQPVPAGQPGCAVSLRVLQQRLRKGGGPTQRLLTLGGLRRVDGYILDQSRGDVILFGVTDSTLPELRTEDFAVALRNTWLRYVRMEGGARIYAHPGCTIDPTPAVLGDLEQLGAASGQDQTAFARAWCQKCSAPQAVRVFGVPVDSHFAKVMVEADYFMKRLSDGSANLGVPGFQSLMDMLMAIAREDVAGDRPVSLPGTLMNRFWLSAGQTRYGEDAGAVAFEECQVVLLTEEERLVAGGVRGRGRPHPLARAFANSFTSRYAEVADRKPIYREALYRFVALARILKSHGVDAELAFLLDEFAVPRIDLRPTVPGLANVRTAEYRRALSQGYQTVRLCLPSCGGVHISPEPRASARASRSLERLRHIKAAALEARPADAVAWAFRL